MHSILLKIFSVALFAPLGAAAYVRFDQLQKSEPANRFIAAKRIVVDNSHRFKIRTITAGVNLKDTTDLATIESAIAFLQKARKEFEAAGYEIQTLRIATQPLTQYLKGKS